MTVAHPTSGSFGAYAEHYISPLAGFLVRYSYWSAVVFAVGTEVTAVAVYMRLWYPQRARSCLDPHLLRRPHCCQRRQRQCLRLRRVRLLTLQDPRDRRVHPARRIRPAHSTRRPQAWVCANYTSHGGFFPHGLSGTWIAVIVAIFSYFSIEMVAVAAGEARDPQHAITRAFRLTIVRLIFIYLLSLSVMLAIVPWNTAGTATSPFVRVAAATHLPYAAGILNLVVLIAALSAMNSQIYITTRMMFSLSRAGFAPRRFGTLNRRGVPLPALLLSTIGIALATAIYILFPASAFILMMSISMFGGLFTWLMIFVTHLRFRRATSGTPLTFRMPGFPWTTLTGIVLLTAILLTTPFTPAFRMTLVYGLPFLALLTAVFLLRHRGTVISLAAHDLSSASHASPSPLSADGTQLRNHRSTPHV